MNNNHNSNRNNNRRRGGRNNNNNNNNNRGGGGGQSLSNNRINSRARGNAPQLLEKYKKLAHDASLNDDRVQTEQYLQFADHYFRVIADNQAQKDEARLKREAERGPADDERAASGQGDAQGDEQESDNRGRRPRAPRNSRDNNRSDSEAGAERGTDGDEDGENPFTPEPRAKKPRQPRVRKAARTDNDGDNQSGLSADMLPPAIARGTDDDEVAEKPKRRTRTAKPRAAKPRDDSDDETLEAVG